ncbi:MAG: hypothetical protein ACRCX2_27290 [Paraclostridium sp.]
MKRITLLLSIIILTSCSTLEVMNKEHTAQRKELRAEQKLKKEEFYKKLKAERELLKAKQMLELASVGTEKHKELKELIASLENFLN